MHIETSVDDIIKFLYSGPISDIDAQDRQRIRMIVASYAQAAVMDSEVAREALQICLSEAD
jgi:hypothetical protein